MFTFYYARKLDGESWHNQVIRARRIGENLSEDVYLDFVDTGAIASELASGLNKDR